MHPNWAAKNGKFDCSVMSLSVLLDYRLEDNKEHSFEVRKLVCGLFLPYTDETNDVIVLPGFTFRGAV